jgi:hypothetical protein
MSYTYVNEDQIDIELICVICNEPFQSPVNCIKCGHTFCQRCIDTWTKQKLSCPSCQQMGNQFPPVITRVVLNQLDRLFVQCSLCQQANIQRSNFNYHISYTCPKHIITCTDKCGWKGCRENLDQHLIVCRQNRFNWFRSPRWWNVFGCVFLVSSIYLIFPNN